jgi:hypothetical protein
MKQDTKNLKTEPRVTTRNGRASRINIDGDRMLRICTVTVAARQKGGSRGRGL